MVELVPERDTERKGQGDSSKFARGAILLKEYYPDTIRESTHKGVN